MESCSCQTADKVKLDTSGSNSAPHPGKGRIPGYSPGTSDSRMPGASPGVGGCWSFELLVYFLPQTVGTIKLTT